MNARITSDNSIDNDRVLQQIKMVYDPEIPIDVYELGLIYEIQIKNNDVFVRMTLTNPACPSGAQILSAVERSIKLLPEVVNGVVELSFDPPYSPSMMSDVAKLELGFM